MAGHHGKKAPQEEKSRFRTAGVPVASRTHDRDDHLSYFVTYLTYFVKRIDRAANFIVRIYLKILLFFAILPKDAKWH